MAKMVGLSRNLKREWLEKAAELKADGLSLEEMREALHDYLGFEIKSQTNLRKTREILLRIWGMENNPYDEELRSMALQLRREEPQDGLTAQWGLLMAAYPIFVDFCSVIGKLAEFQDVMTTAQIRQKIYDIWGERQTLLHGVDKLLATLVSLGALSRVKTGQYAVVRRDIGKQAAVFLLYAMMKTDGGSYYRLASLHMLPVFFPFRFETPQAEINASPLFSWNRFGDEMTVSLAR